jgi:hypothetical protein
VNDPSADKELEVEIDLGEMDWSTPAAWEDSAEALPAPAPPAPAPPAPAPTEAATTAPTEAVAPAPREAHAPQPAPSPRLPPAFARVVGRAGPAGLRELVAATFSRLLAALDTLGVIERALTQPRPPPVGPLFADVRRQGVALLSHVTEAVSGGERLGRRPLEVLDGMRFVIGHELTKVYRHEFPRLAEEAAPPYTRADLSRAWGLLHNCLQQTAITLAQTFEPSATGDQLFDDYRAKVENSHTLYRELHALSRKVSAAEGSSGILLKHSLVRHLEHFREETMHFLMYKDWGEFGRYVDDVKRAFEEMEDFEAVLHEFSQYLSTLIHHVGMREALRGARPHFDEETPPA